MATHRPNLRARQQKPRTRPLVIKCSRQAFTYAGEWHTIEESECAVAAYRAKRLLGSIVYTVNNDHLRLLHVFVKPEHRKRGIFQCMLRRVVKRKGCTSVSGNFMEVWLAGVVDKIVASVWK